MHTARPCAWAWPHAKANVSMLQARAQVVGKVEAALKAADKGKKGKGGDVVAGTSVAGLRDALLKAESIRPVWEVRNCESDGTHGAPVLSK